MSWSSRTELISTIRKPSGLASSWSAGIIELWFLGMFSAVQRVGPRQGIALRDLSERLPPTRYLFWGAVSPVSTGQTIGHSH